MKNQVMQLDKDADSNENKKRISILTWIGRAFLAGIALFFILFFGTERKPLPSEYAARDLYSGQDVSLSDYQGSAVVLMSWATWCMDCKEELSALELLWNSERERGLVVVAVNLDAAGANHRIDTMVSQYQLTYPVWRDPENTFYSTFNAPGIPTTVLMDKQGTVLRAWVGPVDFNDAKVKLEIERAME